MYKRQELKDGDGRTVMASSLDDSNKMLMIWLEAVSYTHLDVYKRQPLKGPDGVQLSTNFKYDGVSGDSFVITDACENPELALRWVDFFFSPDGDLCSQYGAEEGTDWTREVGDAKGLGGDKALYKVLNGYSGEPQNHDWQDIGIRVAPADYRLGQAVEDVYKRQDDICSRLKDSIESEDTSYQALREELDGLSESREEEKASSLLALFGAGLLAGFNPCSISMLLMLFSILLTAQALSLIHISV